MIVLDTHAWLWWVTSPDQLSKRARAEIDAAERIGVSTLSCWEVGMLTERKRIQLDRPVGQWVRAALRVDDRIAAVPPDAEVAVAAALLGARGFHGDPADRFIYATARATGSLLITRDEPMREFDPEHAVW